MVMQSISEYKDFGKISIILKEKMDAQNITVYQMSKLTNLRHQTVKAYYNNAPLTKVDMEVLAKMCYVLDCEIEDILQYIKPKVKQNI